MKAIEIFGKDWKKVQEYVGTRTSAQSRSHAQKVLAKEPTINSPASVLTPKKMPLPEHGGFGECSNANNKSQDNSGSPSKPKNTMTPDTSFRTGFEGPMQRPTMPIRSAMDLGFPELSRDLKRRCTIDISNQNEDEALMIEQDEVSQKLLRKLTTPQKMPRMMSFSHKPMDHFEFKLDFDSDLDSVDYDDLDRKSSCGIQPLNDFVNRFPDD